MKVFYNDIDKFCCGVLRKNINAGSLYAGDVSDKDIREIHGQDLAEYRQIHLFAGIGGFPLGFRWTGMPDDFSILTGGFPCQPFSHAGRRKGSADNRYLWPEMLRVVSEVKPSYVLAENVRGFISLESGKYLDTVYADLEREGYEILPPFVLPACGFGAPHRRDRCWILAYRRHDRRSTQQQLKQKEWSKILDSSRERNVAHSENLLSHECDNNSGIGVERQPLSESRDDGRTQDVADTESICGQIWRTSGEGTRRFTSGGSESGNVSDPASPRLHARPLSGIHSGETSAGSWDEESERLCTFSGHVCDTTFQLPHGSGETRNWGLESANPDWWEVEPAVGRVADGIPGRVDSLKSLGNAIVPQIAAYIGSHILEFDRLVGGTINEPE